MKKTCQKILKFIKDKEDFLFIKHPIVYFIQMVFTTVIGGFTILFLFFGIILFFNTDKFLYHPTNENFYDCTELQEYQKIKHNSTRFYFKENKNSSYAIIYYHGNRGTACGRSYLKKFYSQFNENIIFAEYSGFAGDNIKPSKQLLLQDTKNIQHFLDKKNITKITLIGESLGTAIASYHTTHTNKIESLILIAPFDSVENVAKNSYLKYYPHAIYDYDNYDNIEYLKNYNKELIIIHGDKDRNIPIIRAQNLFNNTNSPKKEFFTIKGSTHNTLYDHYKTFDAIKYGIAE